MALRSLAGKLRGFHRGRAAASPPAANAASAPAASAAAASKESIKLSADSDASLQAFYKELGEQQRILDEEEKRLKRNCRILIGMIVAAFVGNIILIDRAVDQFSAFLKEETHQYMVAKGMVEDNDVDDAKEKGKKKR